MLERRVERLIIDGTGDISASCAGTVGIVHYFSKRTVRTNPSDPEGSTVLTKA